VGKLLADYKLADEDGVEKLKKAERGNIFKDVKGKRI
jgi:hypothetical protein